ncbi:MAG: hypothetical protein IKS42_04505 [Oscillospiraceae bacterium]|nr:hypothetical protein [Oscillospiraceae bacterium]
MKRNVLKMISAVAASLCLISTGSFAANADVVQEPAAPAIAAPVNLEAFMTASGFSAQQIQHIMNTYLDANRYIAYFNITDDPNLLDDFYMHSAGVSTQVNWASTQSYDGYVYNDEIIGTIYTQSSSAYMHKERFIFTITPNANYDNYHLIRYKFHGSGTIATSASDLLDFDLVQYPNVYDYISCGKVEAGNVTKYITGSTNTDSKITADDAQRILQHFNDLNSGLPDPNWTDEATVAADVNFDGVVDALDALAILTAIGNNTHFW